MVSLTLVVFEDVAFIEHTNLQMILVNQCHGQSKSPTDRPTDLFKELAVVAATLSKVVGGDQDVPRVLGLHKLAPQAGSFVNGPII